MGTLAPAASSLSTPPLSGSAQPSRSTEARWSLAFFGILAYLVIEYTRLPAMFPFLLGLQVGKVAVAVAAFGLLLSPRWRGPAESRGIDLAVLGFLVVAFASSVLARNQEMAWQAFGEFARWGVIYFLLSRIVASRWRLHVFVLMLVLLNLKLAQFQIRAYFFEKAWGRSDEFLARGIGAGSVGFFANSNDFGVAMCVVWPLAAVLFFSERKTYLRLIYLASFGAVAVALLLSGSRGALVGAAVTALVVLLRNPRKLLGVAMAVVLLLGTAYILPEANKDRIRSAMDWENDGNVVTRLKLWKTGVRMFADNPVLGVGPGNYRPTYLLYDHSQDDPKRVLAPHSIYIQALSETGALGTIVLLTLVVKALLLNARTCRRTFVPGARRQGYEYNLALALNLAMVGFLTSGAFLTVLHYPHLWFLIGLSVGLARASVVSPAEAMAGAAVQPASKPLGTAAVSSGSVFRPLSVHDVASS